MSVMTQTTETTFKHLKTVLIANRGEIACRLIKACKQNGISTVSVFTKDDSKSPHITDADSAYLLPGTGSSGYIDEEAILSIALESNADGIIPGYGFLSESYDFAAKTKDQGLVFIGPSAEVIKEFGLKHIARQLAIDAGVPTVPGTGLIETVEDAEQAAVKTGFPVLLKASAGGGGVGMKVCYDQSEVGSALAEVKSRSSSLFKNDSIFLEKYVESGRHIEVQVFGNGLGDVLVLGERECSIQRRHQKVVEECPSPFVVKNLKLRDQLCSCAKSLASSVRYKSAGTIEFLVDDETGNFYFLEMNTRLQVEHGITEMTYGVDLVTLMLLQADYEMRGKEGIPGEVLLHASSGTPHPVGHSIEVRIYAENPIKNFTPAPGTLQYVEFPETTIDPSCKLRIDHWVKTGTEITPFFDPLLGKLMVWGPTRNTAIEEMKNMLRATKFHGPPNNLEYLSKIIESENFENGYTLTNTLDQFFFAPKLVEFISPGALTTVQDFPGRLKYNGGIPKSGPLDDLSFRIGNAIIGNELGTEGLEIIFSGPTLLFHSSATISLCGAPFEFKINSKPQKMWCSISIGAGSKVEIGKCLGSSSDKCYLLIKNGFPNIATYLGSKSTSPGISIGGYQGRKFLTGDCLSLPDHEQLKTLSVGYQLPPFLQPNLQPKEEEQDPNFWTVRCLNGPHLTSEIIGSSGRSILYGSEYTVNPNTNRGSTALDGPRCEFSRENGGDGGNHPSNIIEYIYPYRGLSTIADSTVVSGPDGITLSGFICSIVPIEVDWWKLGQAKVGTKIKFVNISYSDALELKQQRESMLQDIEDKKEGIKYIDELDAYQDTSFDDVILYSREAKPGYPMISIRQAGESSIVIDHGITRFSLANCGRLYKMKLDLLSVDLEGINRIEPANGSMTITFDPLVLPRDELVQVIKQIDVSISFEDKLEIPSKKFKLPVSMTHPLIEETITRYIETQRPYAAYLPSNLDYVMKSSCIDTIEQFKARAFNSPQVILAVSFLCASNLMVHIDPRKSFISGKYNPPRIAGPAGSVTTGSVVQGMRAVDGPGGYMLWGIGLRHAFWDTYCMRDNFGELPWFFEPFDQVEFYEVEDEELNKLNELNRIGRFNLVSEPVVFDVAEYYRFQVTVEEEVTELRKKQSTAAAKLLEKDNALKRQWEGELAAKKKVPEVVEVVSGVNVKSPMAANVFKVTVKVGDTVKEGDVMVVLEAMKTEIPVVAEVDGKVVQVVVEEKSLVHPDDTLIVLE